MKKTKQSPYEQRSERMPLLPPFGVMLLIIMLLLVGYAVYWMSRHGQGGTDNSGAATAAQTQPAAPDEWSAKSSRGIALAHIGAALADARMPKERLAEYHTVDEVFGRTPNPVVPVTRKIEEFQRGTYNTLASKVASVSGEPLTDKLSAYNEMSITEKLLLYSDWAGTPTRDLPVYFELINRMNAANVQAITGYGMLDAVWNVSDITTLSGIYQKTGRDKAKLAQSLSEEWLPMFASPITLKLFEPWHKEWAAGQGYIFEITEPKDREKMADAAIAYQIEQGISQEQPRSNDIPLGRPAPKPSDSAGSMDYYKFFYYRIYGEKPGHVLAEGVLQVESYQARQNRWEPQTAKKE
jgi:hypothetical protein